MTRTAKRPIPTGRIKRNQALVFGCMLAVVSTAVLAITLNALAAALLALTVLFYVLVYTVWLKRRTPENIVIGGAAGALPPVIGWSAATGYIGIEPVILFLIIFLWTPAHFWALSINHAREYARAGIPMLPVTAGKPETKRRIVVYSALCMPIAVAPSVFGYAGPVYATIAAVSGAIMLLLAVRLFRSGNDAESHAAARMFSYSIFHLFLLFFALLATAIPVRM